MISFEANKEINIKNVRKERRLDMRKRSLSQYNSRVKRRKYERTSFFMKTINFLDIKATFKSFFFLFNLWLLASGVLFWVLVIGRTLQK
jgi:hypothetical protein